MTATRLPLLVLSCVVSVSFPAISQESTNEAEAEQQKDPSILFQSRPEISFLTQVAGKWSLYQLKGDNIFRLDPEPLRHGIAEIGPYLRSYDLSISARFLAKKKSRIGPRMGLGLYGKNGLTLRLAPSHNRIELVQYGEVLAQAPLRWKSEAWHHLKLTVTAEATHWKVAGKTWAHHRPKPLQPSLLYELSPGALTHPLSGRAFLCGSPFSGYPIFYDDIAVRRVEKTASDKAKNQNSDPSNTNIKNGEQSKENARDAK